MPNEPRLWPIAGVQGDDKLIALHLFKRITKAQWCELFYHIYVQTQGDPQAHLIADDINERLEVIESHCKSAGPLAHL